MKIVSLNINGIRAGERKGFFNWLDRVSPDIVCLQEIKAQEHQLSEAFYPKDYHCQYRPATRPGYSGVAIFSKIKPKKIITGLGFDLCDDEGRYLQFDFDDLSVASLYLPSGSHREDRQLLKYDFMGQLTEIMDGFKRKRREYIICGDWNIAHTKNDIKNWKANQKNSGFLPEEREWLDKVFGPMQWIDAFRVTNQETDQYTWWSNRGRAWDNNVGWRIDYHITSPGLKNKIQGSEIYKAERFSDHAPLIIDYDL